MSLVNLSDIFVLNIKRMNIHALYQSTQNQQLLNYNSIMYDGLNFACQFIVQPRCV
jgi:hypothetical protein